MAEPENYLVGLGHFLLKKGAHVVIEVARVTRISGILVGVIDYNILQAAHYYEDMVKLQIDGKQITYIGPVNL